VSHGSVDLVELYRWIAWYCSDGKAGKKGWKGWLDQYWKAGHLHSDAGGGAAVTPMHLACTWGLSRHRAGMLWLVCRPAANGSCKGSWILVPGKGVCHEGDKLGVLARVVCLDKSLGGAKGGHSVLAQISFMLLEDPLGARCPHVVSIVFRGSLGRGGVACIRGGAAFGAKVVVLIVAILKAGVVVG
jgi:hypothetical protein